MLTVADRELVWKDTIKRARAAGFVRFDEHGVAVLIKDDAPVTPAPAETTAQPLGGDELLGEKGRQGGDGQGQGPQQ